MQKSHENIHTIFVDQLTHDTSLSSDFSIQDFFDNEIFDVIPWLGKVFKVYKGVISISDRILLFKLTKFLQELKNNELSFEDKIKFQDKINSNPKLQDKIGLHLLDLINKIDDDGKTLILVKLFKFLALELITYDEFTSLSYGVIQTRLQYINALLYEEHFNDYDKHNYIKSQLMHTGLITFKSAKPSWGDVKVGIQFELADLGLKFRALMNR